MGLLQGTHALAALLAVGSAFAWGTGDFSGGLASKRAGPLSVTLGSNPVGLAVLVILALVRQSPMVNAHDALVGFVAGVSGAIGLLGLYHALATGKMGIVAPITAVVANIVSMIYGALTEGAPGAVQT